MGLVEMLTIWVVSADDIGCWTNYWAEAPDLESTYASGIVYGCDGEIPIITIYGQNENWDSVWITIKAMNEWTWIVTIWSLNDTGAYWSLYQWWNNYPFPNVADLTSMIITGTTMVDASWYGPWTTTGYYNSNIRYKGPSWDSSYNANKWWGSWDNKINRWFDTGNFSVINSTDRQAMCPEWYHIPSAWEWGALLYLWWKNYDTNQWTQLFTDWSLNKLNSKSSLGWTWMRFSEDMQIPFVGQRNYDFKASPNSSAGYWSSTPYSDRANYIRAYFFGNDSMFWWDYSDGFGYAVRCFKNEYVIPPQIFTLTFLDDGVEVALWSVVSGEVRTGTIPTPDEKDWYRFDYRYADGIDTEFDFTSPITGDVKLHAHRTFTAKIPNGIYTWVDENWNQVKTLIFWWNNTFSGVQLTVKMENQSWNYYRWFNKNTDNSYSFPWNASWCTWAYLSWDGKLGWCTNWVDNARWWSWDTVENWFNPSPINFDERQWPCEEWYHVPSRWERNALAIARCNDISNDICNPNTDFQPAWDGTDFIYISNSWAWSIFQTEFNVGTSDYYGFWSSSPGPDRSYTAYRLVVDGYAVNPNYSNGRYGNLSVRCFKNYITVPYIFTINFLNGDEHVWSGDIVSWDKISEEVISWYNLTWLTKEWYTFSGWIISGSDEMFDVENDIITTWMILNAVWQVNQYTMTFKDWDKEITSITADYWTWITPPPNPTKNGHIFKWWDKPVPSTMPAEDTIISAKWERNWSSGWWGWGGGWGGSSKTDTGSASSQTWNQINSNTGDTASTWTNVKEPETNTGSNTQTWSQQPLSPMDSSLDREQTVTPLIGGDGEARGGWTQTYTQEFQEAYEFAKWNWITTMPTIQKANMEWKLTRIAMAKMLSQYAMNVLWQKPANIVTPEFNDVTDKLNSDYDDWVTLAYQLWIMWQNMPWNNFRPNDEVTRAEFATALSRMAYWTSDWEYKWTAKYYIHHMEKLVREWIITNDDPNMKELRWYVMIMLMRSSK